MVMTEAITFESFCSIVIFPVVSDLDERIFEEFVADLDNSCALIFRKKGFSFIKPVNKNVSITIIKIVTKRKIF